MLSSLIGKLESVQDAFRDGLPPQAMKRLARKFLLWTLHPPVRTGKLRSSGSAWIGRKKVFGAGGTSGHFQARAKDNVITVSYSAPKKASEDAKVFYHFRGSRWFDYAEKQHKEHATNKLWTAVLWTKAVQVAVQRETERTLREAWSK